MSRDKISVNAMSGCREEDVLAAVGVPPTGENRLRRGRNSIWKARVGGRIAVIKRFNSDLKNRLIYSCRASKAIRSFNNAMELVRRGFATPLPIAMIERRGPLNTLTDSYYICDYEEAMDLEDAMDLYGEKSLREFARYVRDLHEAGIRHDDLNDTNVRIVIDGEGRWHFSVIDLNRMKLYPPGSGVPMDDRFENITRFCRLDDNFRFFAKEYFGLIGHPELYDRAIRVKEAHDRHRRRNKAWKKLIPWRKKK